MVGVKSLVKPPSFPRPGPHTPERRLQLQIISGGCADLRIGGRSSDLLIGNQIPLIALSKVRDLRDAATALLPAWSLPGGGSRFSGVLKKDFGVQDAAKRALS